MTLRKNKVVIFLLLGLAMFVTGCGKFTASSNVVVPRSKTDQLAKTTNYGNYDQKEQNLASFLAKEMVTKKGVYTNYQQQDYVAKQATGHEMLSESSGLWLEYLAYTHQYKKFRQFYKETKKTFDQGSQFSYRYTPETGKKSNVNATLDDLRIIKSLQIYAELKNSDSYRHEAAVRFDRLQENTMARGKIASFYDVKAKQASDDSALAYYDLATLKYFESTSKAEKKKYQEQLTVVKSGFLGDAFPLYATSYNWSNKSYSDANLNTSEALETILHLAEIGQVKQVTLNWLERQVNEDTLYNTYTSSGSVIDKNESAGSYALTAQIFANAKNKKMYRKSMALAWKYQINNQDSKMFGAIGIDNKEAYSYNNLMTLIASRY